MEIPTEIALWNVSSNLKKSTRNKARGEKVSLHCCVCTVSICLVFISFYYMVGALLCAGEASSHRQGHQAQFKGKGPTKCFKSANS